jgi:hypothetical protein
MQRFLLYGGVLALAIGAIVVLQPILFAPPHAVAEAPRASISPETLLQRIDVRMLPETEMPEI